MRVGIFGGTFDPPHIGHINMCEVFIKELSLDKLYVIPTYIPPHKDVTSQTTAAQRYEMAKLAFSYVSDKIVVSDIEQKRQGRSYTADTLRFFREQGYNDLFFLCGTDMFLSLDKWYNPEYIFESATIVCLRRESEKENDSRINEKINLYKQNYNGKTILLNSRAVEISSSEIRDAYKNGACMSNYITEEICNYIQLNKLYTDK